MPTFPLASTIAAMSRIPRSLAAAERLVAALWAGSLWFAGLLAAPWLFHAVDDRALAGSIAGGLFHLGSLLAYGSGMLVLVIRALRTGGAVWRSPLVAIVVVMLALTATGDRWLRPAINDIRSRAGGALTEESDDYRRFARLHGMASVLYLGNCLLAAPLVLLAGTSDRRAADPRSG